MYANYTHRSAKLQRKLSYHLASLVEIFEKKKSKKKMTGVSNGLEEENKRLKSELEKVKSESIMIIKALKQMLHGTVPNLFHFIV